MASLISPIRKPARPLRSPFLISAMTTAPAAGSARWAWDMIFRAGLGQTL